VDKLKEIGLIEEARDLLIGELIQDNFLNETRFAESYVRGKFFFQKMG
jgi:regulatory protein